MFDNGKNKIIQINPEVEPFNLCFGLYNSIPSYYLGFTNGAIQWGKDGSIMSNPYMIPPFEAPFIHNFDHPDYILIYLEEGKKATTLQHAYGNTVTVPFAKLVLYPLFREERMLPRDTTLLSGEAMNKFTLKFKNPDGTPYHFHGAQFSFSLNFVSMNDGA